MQSGQPILGVKLVVSDRLSNHNLEGPIYKDTLDIIADCYTFIYFRACLEKMLRSHVQHLQEELAHMERTAAASSRHLMGGNINQGRDGKNP